MPAFYIRNLLTEEIINLDDCKRGLLANGRYNVYVPQVDFHFATHLHSSQLEKGSLLDSSQTFK